MLDLNEWSCDSWVANAKMYTENRIFVYHLWMAGWDSRDGSERRTDKPGYSIGVQLNEIDSKRFYLLLLSLAETTTVNLTYNETSWRFGFIFSLFFHSRSNVIKLLSIWISLGFTVCLGFEFDVVSCACVCVAKLGIDFLSLGRSFIRDLHSVRLNVVKLRYLPSEILGQWCQRHVVQS